MSADEGFLADVVAHPDDDAPRLIYADWLEEQGQPERAEFIRVQCRLAVSPEDGALRRRERELLATHGEAWRAEVPAWARAECEFRRGFVSAMTCHVRDWLRHGDELVRLLPIEELCFCADLSADAAPLADAPSLARLRCLIVAYVGLGDAGAARLAASPHLGQLDELSLAGNGLSADGAAFVARSRYLAGLRALDLRDNPIGDS